MRAARWRASPPSSACPPTPGAELGLRQGDGQNQYEADAANEFHEIVRAQNGSGGDIGSRTRGAT